MKIYTEVNFKWDEDSDELIEVSSESYDIDEKEAIANGELALCGYCGDYKGDDKAGAQDKSSMNMAHDSLKDIFHQYKKNSDPFDSFFANEIERMKETTANKKNEAEDRFNLVKDQKRESYNLSKQQGAMSYEQAAASTKKNLQKMQQNATRQAEGLRTDAAADMYGASLAQGQGGMASVGGRTARLMADKAKRSVGGVALELNQAREEAKDRLRDTESQASMNLSEQAMGMTQANEAAEQEMTQTQDNLQREMDAFSDKMLQEQTSAMDGLRSEARGVVTATSSSFMNPYSTWGKPGGVNNKANLGDYEPDWYKPFDDWDEEQGLDTGWSDAHS